MVADLYLLILLLLNMTEPVFQEDDSKWEVQKRETELLIVSHDILGKEYELDGVSFTVLGIQPVYYTDEDEQQDVQWNVATITDINSQRVPIISFQGGMACITKIRIGDEVIVGYSDILKKIAPIEQAPEGWLTKNGLAQELKISYETINKIADKYRATHPDWFHIYIVASGLREHFSPQLCDIIRNKIAEEEHAPEGWLTTGALALELKKDFLTVKRIAEQHLATHPDWFHVYMIVEGQFRTHFSPKLCDIIRNKIAEKEHAPEGWFTTRSLARELKKGFLTVKRIAEQHLATHPDWFHAYKVVGGQFCNHYSPELCDIIRNKISEEEHASEGWMTKNGLAQELKISYETINKITDKHRATHPNWFHVYMTATGLQE